MTKEEIINKFIERYKEHKNNGVTWSMSLYDCCQGIDCDDCPFDECDCDEDIAMSLLDRLVKAEESQKAETNLEHYIVRNGVHITKEPEVEVWEFRFKKGTEKQFFDANIKSVLDWLLSPYEPPNYKLTQFEYDLLQSFNDYTYPRDGTIHKFGCLTDMQEKGYFNGVPTDAQIEDVLDNSEVVE